MSFEEWAPTLHASELTSWGNASSRDTRRQSIRDLHMLEDENANLRKMMQLLQDNKLYKSHIKSAYGTKCMSPIPSSSSVEMSGLSDSAGRSSRATTPPASPIKHRRKASSNFGVTNAGLTSPICASTIRASPSQIAPPQFTSTRQFNPSKPTLKMSGYDEVKTAYVAKVSSIAHPQTTSSRQFNSRKPTLKLPGYDEVKTAYVAKVSSIAHPQTTSSRQFNSRKPTLKLPGYDEVKTAYVAKVSSIAPPQGNSSRQFNPRKSTLKLPGDDEMKTAFSRNSTCNVDSLCTCSAGKKGQRSAHCQLNPAACRNTAKNEILSERPSKGVGGATKGQPSSRMLGEIAFQMDKRFLDYIFSPGGANEAGERKRRRFYGYTVKNIHTSIRQEYTNKKGAIDEFLEFQLNYRLKFILISLGQFGFKLDEHGSFAQDMINKYGLLNTTPDCTYLDAFGLADAETLRGFVNVLAKDLEMKKNMLVLLECLLFLANEDGRPIFLY